MNEAMMKINVLLCIALISISSCKDPIEEDNTIRAIVNLNSIHQETDNTYQVGVNPHGQILISQKDSVVTFEIQLENFAANTLHAVHLHIGSCAEPGMHWNQGKDMTTKFCNERSLGIPWGKPKAGDVGNVSVGYDGTGSYTIKTDLWRLNSLDDRDIIGKAVVIHGTFDDFTTECDPSHDHNHPHTNPKVACGTIELITE
ncbi:MAG: superoxide dismutase family protein [Marinoscillum sp.]